MKYFTVALILWLYAMDIINSVKLNNLAGEVEMLRARLGAVEAP